MAKGSRGGKNKGGGVGADNEPLEVGKSLYIPEWFANKMNIPDYAMSPFPDDPMDIVGETEKAWKVKYFTETKDGERDLYLTGWVPKSVAMNKAKKKEEWAKEAAREEKREKNYEAGKIKYANMLDFAKKNGVKGVRKGMRKETILKKIRDAGHKYEY